MWDTLGIINTVCQCKFGWTATKEVLKKHTRKKKARGEEAVKKEEFDFRTSLGLDYAIDRGLHLNSWMILLTDLHSYPDMYVVT